VAAEDNGADTRLDIKTIGPKLITEFIGTLFLTLAVGMSGKSNPAAPLCIGGTLVAMVYMGGHVSGAHYNPTVSIAVFVRGLLRIEELGLYFLFQLLGSFAGGGIALAFTGQEGLGYPNFTYYWHAAIAEFLWSGLLATVVLQAATSSATTNNSYFGLAIGFTVFSGAVIVGPISGGAFNTAVGLALPILANDPVKCWMYVVAPPLGGVAAGLLFHFTSPKDCSKQLIRCLPGAVSLTAACFMEFVITFFLALYVGLRPYHNANPLSPVALFALATALLFTAGSVSGAHMNPAVSIGVYARFRLSRTSNDQSVFPLKNLALYIVTQCVAALAAAGTASVFMYTDAVRPIGFPLPPNPTKYGMVPAFFGEMLGTFALMLVILNTATVKITEGNSYCGIAIGVTIAAVANTIGPITGGCLNPALTLLTAVRATLPFAYDFAPMWVYFVAPPLGALLAALIFRVQNLDEFDEAAPAVVAKRYSVMTDGIEVDTQYNNMMRLNMAGDEVKRASVRASLKRASQRTSVQSASVQSADIEMASSQA